MPNEKDRKKKDHVNTGKKSERMRASERERHEQAHAPGRSTDQPDIQTYKPGAADDRTQRGAR